MRSAFINLPYPRPVVRRYMCSYYAPSFLFPPMEILYLAGMAAGIPGTDIFFCDAIAEKKSIDSLVERLRAFSPDIICTMTGLDTIEADIKYLNAIKKGLPRSRMILIGYYPTLFPGEILENSEADMIIRGEPEITFQKVCGVLVKGKNPEEIEGIAYRINGRIETGSVSPRIDNVDALPFPDRGLLRIDAYSEPFMPKPFATILAGRGCPGSCNFCVKSYGSIRSMRTPENVMDEIQYLHNEFGIRAIRFLDDTFTLNREWITDLCGLISRAGLPIVWSALARIDTLDEDLLDVMSGAGCERLYIGIESASDKILKYLSKGIDEKTLYNKMNIIAGAPMETYGFFLVGSPGEKTDDINKSIQYAQKAGFDFAQAQNLQIFPGTPLFDRERESIEFQLFPTYIHRFKNSSFEEEAVAREKKFYRGFCLRPRFILRSIRLFFKYPLTFIGMFLNYCKYLLSPVKESRYLFFRLIFPGSGREKTGF